MGTGRWLATVALAHCLACGGGTTPADPCATKSCLNGGTCAVTGGAAACTCAAGFTGPTCAQRLPTATSLQPPASVTAGAAATLVARFEDPDQLVAAVAWSFGDGSAGTSDTAFVRAGATLTSTVQHAFAAAGTFTVSATVTAAGQAATKSASVTVLPATADPCSPNPCLNGGTCTAPSGSATCACAGGFTGATCAQHLPTAVALQPPASPTAGAPATFVAAIDDPDALVAAVAWTFGDGSDAVLDTAFARAGAAVTSTMQHTYAAAGTFGVGVAVAVSGQVSSKAANVTVAPGTAPTCSKTSFTITAPGFQYAVDGVGNNPAITVCRGQTFTFHLDNVSSSHPFCIWNANDTNAPPGVTNNCVSGTADVVWAVPANFAGAARYICDIHFFGNAFTIQ